MNSKHRYLSIDIGTTCCKCQCFSNTGEILYYASYEYPILNLDDTLFVNILIIQSYVFKMIKDAYSKCHISSICFSSLGECFVSIDKDDNIAYLPILYSDPKGDKEASDVKKIIDNEYMFNHTGCVPQGMFSVYKLLYIKNNKPDIYKKIRRVLLISEYFSYLLSGVAMIDYSLAARTGIFNIETLTFDKDIAYKLGIDLSLFSNPMPTGSVVGNMKEEFKQELNIDDDITIVLGSHDQVCNALGCGCLNVGDATDGMGTVECITPIFSINKKDYHMGEQGMPLVPFLKKGLYCTYLCNYSCNAITNWLKNEINHNYYEGDNYFEYMEKHMSEEVSSIYVLPYFNGNCVPYQDTDIKGSIIGLTTKTKDYEIYQGVCESLNFEMRFELEVSKKYGINVSNLVATGGGSLSSYRLSNKANVLGVKVKTLRSQEGGLCGAAILQAVALKDYPNFQSAIDVFVRYKDIYYPNNVHKEKLDKKYEKYLSLYKILKTI